MKAYIYIFFALQYPTKISVGVFDRTYRKLAERVARSMALQSICPFTGPLLVPALACPVRPPLCACANALPGCAEPPL